MALFLSFLTAMFVTMLLIPPLIRGAERWRIVDVPDSTRKVHSQTIPRIGGVAMVCGALLPVLLWLPFAREVTAFLVGSLLILAFGVWDDRVNLSYRVKFAGQLLAVAVVVGFGHIAFQHLPLASAGELGWYISVPVTVLFLLGVTNAINLSDGLDGLAGGTALLSIGAIAVLAFMGDNLPVAFMSLAVIGSILGFLRFNTHPARVFMGDAGSQFLGFTAGVLAILLTQHGHAAVSAALPLLLLGWPLLDTATVMVQRIVEGRSPFSADKNHLHHKLLRMGFAHHEAVFVAYVAQSGLVLLAYYLRFESDALVMTTFVLAAVVILAAIHVPLARGWRKPSTEHHRALPASTEQNSQVTARVALWAARFAVVSLLVLVVLIALLAAPLTPTMGGTLLALWVVLAVVAWRHGSYPLTWFERGAIYVLGALLVFALQSAPAALAQVRGVLDIYFVLLAFAVVAGFRWSRTRSFAMTPLDYLVIFIAFAVPSLPGTVLQQLHVGEFIAKLIVLFYGVELALHHGGVTRHSARVAMLGVCALLAGRGLIS